MRVFLLTVQELEQQLAGLDTIEGKLSIYETLTNELMTAQQSLRDELREDPVSRGKWGWWCYGERYTLFIAGVT